MEDYRECRNDREKAASCSDVRCQEEAPVDCRDMDRQRCAPPQANACRQQNPEASRRAARRRRRQGACRVPKSRRRRQVANRARECRRRQRQRLRRGSFSLYVRRVMRLVHPDLNLSEQTVHEIDIMLSFLSCRLCEAGVRLLYYSNRKTLSVRELQNAVRLLLPGELSKHADSQGVRALQTYQKRCS
ncbi:hypothetical protein NDU88_007856 [Pleurodeles waltl]|uniref:Core Histone H2A/H2B/H3 domain-containing protein n=1 Tax=Pleurodeles waltl TaxID=8319 RepID=A0AAV7VVK4_PLEWA|nr:hypothetical protein NDU88_007856 [Pleurodeles waltl]